MDSFAAAVRQTICEWQMVEEGQGVLAAVSGGADSVSLLAVLLELGHPVVAAHFNHGWRGSESDRDEDFVRQLCRRLGVTVAVGRAEPGAPASGGGREETARLQRYAFLHGAARHHGCLRIATGHTREDQAETLLLRLMRGAGATGLRGILPRRRDGVVRPLLDVSRHDVLGYLARRGLEHVDDGSNTDPRFARNRLRLEVMPLLRRYDPRIEEHLAAAARSFFFAERGDRAVGEALAARLVDGAGRLDAARLAEEAPRRQRLAVRAWLRQRRGDLRAIGAAHVESVVSCRRSGARVELPRRQVVCNEHGRLRLLDADAAGPLAPHELALRPGEAVVFGGRWRLAASPIESVEPGTSPALPADASEALLDADRIATPLAVRVWRAGDRIQPLGMSGHRKLSDVFIDAKIPRWRRTRLPVIEVGGRILWVPGVIRSEDGRVDSATARVIRLRGEEAPVGG